MMKPIQGDGWPQDPAAFGSAVRRAREACGLTQKALAERIGVKEATVRNVETGLKASSITRALLIKALGRVPS